MKRLLVVSTLFLSLGLITASPTPSFAADCGTGSTIDTGSNFPCVHQVDKSKNLFEVAAIVIEFLLALAGALAVIFLIVGGIRYIFSSGSPDAIDRAKKTVTYAIVGIIVVLLSYIIVNALNNAASQTGYNPSGHLAVLDKNA